MEREGFRVPAGGAARVSGEFVEYRAIVDRPKIVWPGDAKVAVWLALNIEHYQFLPPRNDYINPWPRVAQAPDTMMYSYYDYSNRVGLWRMLGAIDDSGMPITASLNVAVLDHYPEITAAIRERSWDVMCHGLYNTEYLFGMDEEVERSFFEDVTSSVLEHLGTPLRGFFGPAGSTTLNTMNLAAEHGIRYCADWGIDDQPVPVRTSGGRLVSVPYGFEINDDALLSLGYGSAGLEADDFLQMAIDQYEALSSDAADTGRVMCVALHGYVFGQPHRIAVLRQLIEYLLGRQDAWVTTGAAIADYYLENFYDAYLAAPAEDGGP